MKKQPASDAVRSAAHLPGHSSDRTAHCVPAVLADGSGTLANGARANRPETIRAVRMVSGVTGSAGSWHQVDGSP
jgi:hypothetical protein